MKTWGGKAITKINQLAMYIQVSRKGLYLEFSIPRYAMDGMGRGKRLALGKKGHLGGEGESANM